ncbi:LysM peptidoglycan-binding domain-containing M23 family metallopeptidase [bacterium]|nr:LysM peptidoglycan-binding domain-containing M23 family metallopeptidase [bacterium]
MKSRFLIVVASLVLSACAGIQSRYHRVTSGESLQKVATLYSVPVESLQRFNEDTLAQGLKPGQKLYIPFEEREDWDAEFYDDTNNGRVVASVDPADIGKVTFLWPVKGRISSRFGSRYMHGRGRHFHEGIDIAAKKGTPVKAARSGHVVYATSRIPGYGNMVIVQHPDKYSSVYAHLTKIDVRKGQFVTRGQTVGTVGRTGRATGAHLHFEVRAKRQPVDPTPLMFEQFARNH